ncbi:MAG TPA: UvrD-helicase domain-containing protein [Arenimonas sp.]|nr:UvrD-helicase domain-containing protein [Arenimonas sp.]
MTEHRVETQSRDWRELKLDGNGQSLIEASAGTGKTWTIGVLYLRLLLEQKLTPKQIVVTTFTNAAADELRARLRSRLIWAEKRAVSGTESQDAEDSAALWLQERWQDDPQARHDDLQRLRLALTELDLAPISTLHGLCQRILSDCPFAAGTLFKQDQLISGQSLLSELAKDLRRLVFQGTDQELLKLHKLSGDKLSDLPKKLALLLQPGSTMYCRTEVEIRQMLPIENAKKLRDIAQQEAFFSKDSKLSEYWLQLAEKIENPFNSDVLNSHCLNALKNTAAKLENSVKVASLNAKGNASPEVLQAAKIAESIAESGILEYLKLHNKRAFWSAVGDWTKEQASSRLAARSQRSFDDLLSTVHGVLYANKGQALADALFNSWPVALVDEFQDTDGIQYGILQRIYRGAENAKRGRLVMIGDPKQAIYRFRGGDVRAYLHAKNEVDVDGHLTLGINHRSSKAYVAAVNEFYGLAGKKLSALEANNAIEYLEVEPSDRNDDTPYLINGLPCEKPLVIHYSSNALASAGERKDEALKICANQIQAMLASGIHCIGDKALAPSDIAVLLPANYQLIELRDLLIARNVPCVTMARSSVFATDTAKELQIILFAVANCDDLGALRAAVATRLWGYDYAKLREMGDNPVSWHALSRKYHDWREIWHKQGLQSVINALIEEIGAEQLNCTSGERVLTDLRHLGELLQAQSNDLIGLEELLVWFADQRSSADADDEEAAESAQLRIESDAKRVQLMTLHASKGLEFPIVFLPLMWAHGEGKSIGISQTSNVDGQKQLDLSDESQDIQNEELQDERFRVLYVAITRAIHACHIFALPHDRPKKKGLVEPNSGTQRSALDVMLSRLPQPIVCHELNHKSECIEWIPQWAPEAASQSIADEIIPSTRVARALPEPKHRVLPSKHSFTTLMRKYDKPVLEQGLPAEDETDFDATNGFDLDESDQTDVRLNSSHVENSHAELLKLELVRGADFGNAIHSIFENRDLSKSLLEQTDLIKHFLAQNNVRIHDGRKDDWLANALSARLQTVLDTPLSDLQDAPRLSDLKPSDLRAEMEFHYSLDTVSLQAMRKVCVRHGEAELVPDNPRTLNGLMNGKIDLTFQHNGRYHVLDYKGNYLGNQLSDYVGNALLVNMDHSHYRFQALLYTLAVDRYLSQRIIGYERSKQLGDCYYLFIRAVGLGNGAGIWHHRFSDAMLNDLQEILSGIPTVGAE